MVFAFSHTPIISTFAIDQQEKHGDRPWVNAKKIMKVAYTIICASVLFFVFSCLLAIPATYIETARDQGVTILSALSMVPRRAGMAGGDRHHRRRRRYVEVVSRNLLRSD